MACARRDTSTAKDGSRAWCRSCRLRRASRRGSTRAAQAPTTVPKDPCGDRFRSAGTGSAIRAALPKYPPDRPAPTTSGGSIHFLEHRFDISAGRGQGGLQQSFLQPLDRLSAPAASHAAQDRRDRRARAEFSGEMPDEHPSRPAADAAQNKLLIEKLLKRRPKRRQRNHRTCIARIFMRTLHERSRSVQVASQRSQPPHGASHARGRVAIAVGVSVVVTGAGSAAGMASASAIRV